ncbi:MAG: YARHG domain-containing protein [Aestuariivita sp.]|nr:YARHG domain-containing protein [Aestuariivita sp.]
MTKYLMQFVAFILAFSPSLAQAELCDELWFTRNLVFDRARYCFGTTLGRATFDNSDCMTRSPVLSEEDQRIIAEVQAVEEDFSFSVDTSRT